MYVYDAFYRDGLKFTVIETRYPELDIVVEKVAYKIINSCGPASSELPLDRKPNGCQTQCFGESREPVGPEGLKAAVDVASTAAPPPPGSGMSADRSPRRVPSASSIPTSNTLELRDEEKSKTAARA